ncbi:hypothetical protein Q7P37_009543 [Cladosporium fusiforme]
MASQNGNSASNGQDESFSKMSTGDVEAIGAHCQMPYCRQLDLLPFRCESCKGKFCLDHRTETAHECSKAGEWAKNRAAANQGPKSNVPVSAKPNILTHEQQCADPGCKTLINTPLVTGVHCDKCNRSYCLKHRFTYEHNCDNLTPIGARPKQETQKEKGRAALDRLRAWGAAKKASMPKAPVSKTKQAAAAQAQELANLKRTAKGEAKIPQEKRVYLFVEASSDTITAKLPKGNFFYSTEYSVGRVLDLAAKSLQVSNLNNKVEGEDDKLRVFHVEGGRLLEYGEKLGASVQTGNTIVLLRGVGAGMAQTPDKMT